VLSLSIGGKPPNPQTFLKTIKQLKNGLGDRQTGKPPKWVGSVKKFSKTL